MTDDLVKRLWLYDCEGITREAADAIEELEVKLQESRRVAADWFEEQKKANTKAINAEAKLAKAVLALVAITKVPSRMTDSEEMDWIARNTLTELKGGKDE